MLDGLSCEGTVLSNLAFRIAEISQECPWLEGELLGAQTLRLQDGRKFGPGGTG